MDETTNLKLPFIMPAQAQKHVTHNEALRGLDALVQLAVLDRDLSAPPASPAEGARYMVAASPAGAWAGQPGKIAAWQDGAWAFHAPVEGWLAWIADENVLIVFDGGSWGSVITGLTFQNLPMVGVNTTADTTNRLAVRAPAALFTHEGNGHQVKVNKNAAADTASFLFQTGFSGRAEIGLAGNDDFSLKTSHDGTVFRTPLKAFARSGRIDIMDAQRRACAYWTAMGNGTTVHVQGFGETAAGTPTARTVAAGSLFASQRRLGYVSAGAAGSSAGTRHGSLQFWRGNAAGLGGFFYTARFGIAAAVAQTRAFIGLHASAAVIGNVNPSTLLNMVGLAADSTQTTWRIMTNDGAGAATAVDLGAIFPANTSNADLYELQLWCDPDAAAISYRVERLNTGNVSEGDLATDLPVNSTFLAPQIWINNGTTGTATAIDVLSQYVETGFGP